MSLSAGAIVGISIASYVVFAYVLVRIVPFRLSRASRRATLRKKFSFSLKASAHRGGSLNGPENTLFAFRRALEDGKTNMLEMDVNMSADGIAIVSHDLSLERICDPPHHDKLVADLTLGDDPNNLPQVKRRIQLHFPSEDKGHWYDAESTGAVIPVDHTTRLLPLSEVFDAFPAIPIHLDIKAKSDALTHQVVDMIESYGRESITIVGTASANTAALKDALQRASKSKAQVDPNSSEESRLRNQPLIRRKVFRTFASLSQVMLVYIAYYLGILPLMPLPFDLFSIPGPTAVKKRLFGGAIGPIKASLAMSILKTPAMWEHLQRRGIGVICWVLNDVAEFEEALKWPINGIMTDDPIALRNFFETHPLDEHSGMLCW